MILALQEHLYQKLNITSITNKITGVYYQVPANSKFPYIYIGEFHSKDRSTKDQIIEEISFKLSIYLRDKSLKSMLELSSDIKNLLKSDRDILVHFVEEKIILQNDGITHQVNLSFKAIIGDLRDV